MSFISFCEMMFNKYPGIDGNKLLLMCEVAWAELNEEENAE